MIDEVCTYGDGEDHTTLAEQGGGGGPALLQGVHRLLDNPGDIELEQINCQQGEDPPEQPLPVFPEIRHQQPEGLAGLDQLSKGWKEFNVATFCLVIRENGHRPGIAGSHVFILDEHGLSPIVPNVNSDFLIRSHLALAYFLVPISGVNRIK